MMSYKIKVSIVLSLFLMICCVGMVCAAGPVLQWTATQGTGVGQIPFVGGNTYYGFATGDHYYAGLLSTGDNIDGNGGILEFDNAGLVHAKQVNSTSKSAIRIGDSIYFGYTTPTGKSILKLDALDWSATPTTVTFDNGYLESMATDGTNVYANDYSGGSVKTPVRKYSLDSLTTIWEANIPDPGRIRGLSYYAPTNMLYVVDGSKHRIWELNASDGTGSLAIEISMSGTLYQAVRYGNMIYAVSDNGNLYVYKFSDSKWGTSPEYIYDLGLGAMYGIGINSQGNGIWVSSIGLKVSYFKLGHTATGEITLGGFTADPTGIPVEVDATNVDTSEVRTVQTTLVGTGVGTGTFTIQDVVPGSYTVKIKPSHWLKYLILDNPGHAYEIPMADADVNLHMVKGLDGQPYSFINGDINGDNKVNFADYAILAAQYNKVPSTPTADLNGSGKVNFADYAILAAQYNKAGDP